jgi:predicted phosphodiesterase
MEHLPEAFAALPTVYAVRDSYQIIVPVTCETLMWVSVGGRDYYDDANGVLRSSLTTHKMIVPREALDRAREYTVCWRRVFNRLPYRSQVGEVETYTSPFKPVEGDTIRIYHIADAHNLIDPPVAAGSYFGDKLDALILNGDNINHSGQIESFTAIYQIAAGITKGRIPTIFSRGNHDMRGIYAEKLPEHTPTDNGNSYFTFRLGAIWGIVLDCGEDKPDDHEEYGHTVCCHDFRLRETEFIKEVIANAEKEYKAEGVTHRIVVCHNPFTQRFQPPFDIEDEVFGEWAKLLGEHIKPQVMICGHTHKMYVSDIGSEYDHRGQFCPVVVASAVNRHEGYFAGGALTFTQGNINVVFNDNRLNVIAEQNIKL